MNFSVAFNQKFIREMFELSSSCIYEFSSKLIVFAAFFFHKVAGRRGQKMLENYFGFYMVSPISSLFI